MEPTQAPQPTAPAQAPTAQAPAAAPPAAAPAQNYVAPNNYVSPNNTAPPGAAVGAYPQAYADAAATPTTANANAGAATPIVRADGSAQAAVFPTPNASANTAVTVTPAPNTVIQGNAGVSTATGPQANVVARTGDAQNGAQVAVDSNGNAAGNIQGNNGQGTAGQMNGQTDGRNWSINGSGTVPAGPGQLTGSGSASGGPGQTPSGNARLDLGLPQLQASAYANDVGTPNANGGLGFRTQIPVSNQVTITGSGAGTVGPNGPAGNIQGGVQYQNGPVTIEGHGNVSADQQNGVQGGGGASVTVTQ
jgi:hypothetical protein